MKFLYQSGALIGCTGTHFLLKKQWFPAFLPAVQYKHDTFGGFAAATGNNAGAMADKEPADERFG